MTDWRVERLSEPALQGLSTGDLERRAIHIHGSWGNFYENPIALETQAAYSPRGFGYASVNTLGHDAGTIDEDISASTSDILAWVEYFNARGTSEWILQGHSLGALKIIRGLLDSAFGAGVRGAVLLSPFDLPAFYAGSASNDEIDAKRSRAEQLVARNGAAELAPTELFSTWPVSLGTIESALTRGGPLDVFQSREGNVDSLGRLGVPTLVILGGADFAATPDNHDVAQLVASAGAEVALIEGAPHNFAGFEDQVNEAIAQFLDRLV